MKVISHGSLEEELKKVLSNPHTSNNLEKAVQIAEEIIKIDKTSNYANYAMGLHELALANRTAPQVDYDRPVEAFKKIIKMDPNFIEPYLMLAKIYRETDRNLEYKLLLKANKQLCMKRVVKRDFLERGKSKLNAQRDFKKSYK